MTYLLAHQLWVNPGTTENENFAGTVNLVCGRTKLAHCFLATKWLIDLTQAVQCASKFNSSHAGNCSITVNTLLGQTAF